MSSMGVFKKVLAQCEILNIPKHHVVNLISVRGIFRLLKLPFISNVNVYCRESLISSLVMFLMTFVMKFKLVVEVNRAYNNKLGRRGRFFLNVRNMLAGMIYKKANKMVCVTQEIKNSFSGASFFNKCIFVPNIYSYNDIDAVSVKDEVKYDAVFLGDTNQLWQAPELISSLARQYPNMSILHIGDGGFDEQNIDSIGIIKSDLKLNQHLSTCRVALSQLGLKRIGLTEAYPLKHASYVRNSLPIVSGAQDKLLMESGYSYHYLIRENVNDLYEAISNLSLVNVDKFSLIDKIDEYKNIYSKVLDG